MGRVCFVLSPVSEAQPHPSDEDLSFTPTSKDRSLGTPNSPGAPRDRGHPIFVAD